MRTQGPSLADVRSNNVLDKPVFNLYEEVIRLLVKYTQQYDTVMVIPAAEHPYQEFPTVAAMTGGIYG